MVRPTDKTSPEKTGVVYITCNGCGEHCIGETSRALRKKLGEYPQKQTASAAWEHQSTANHEIEGRGSRSLTRRRETLKEKTRRSSITDASVQP